jgi:esterase
MLSHDEIKSAQPGAHMLYVLHGIFGAGRNWSSVIRRFVRACPDWNARLLDLRQHGLSQGFSGPHTIEAAARDIFDLSQHLGEQPAAILGHSFGGKVSLMYAREHPEGLKQVWVIDSTPEARTPDGSAWNMLEIIRQTPREFESRDQLVELLMQSRVNKPTAQWMATNLENQDGVYRWRFDFDSIEELLRDFFNEDMWSVLESPPPGCEVHIVKAEESSILTPAAMQRVTDIGKQNGQVFLHRLAGGHWVNAENPEGLLSLLTARLHG